MVKVNGQGQMYGRHTHTECLIGPSIGRYLVRIQGMHGEC